MKIPPRPLDELLIGVPQIIFGLIQGLVVLLTCLTLYRWSLLHGNGADIARTLTFICLMTGNLIITRVIGCRGALLNKEIYLQPSSYWLISVLSVIIVVICIELPWLRNIFGFAMPNFHQAVIAICSGLLAGVAMELVKWHPTIYRILGGGSMKIVK